MRKGSMRGKEEDGGAHLGGSEILDDGDLVACSEWGGGARVVSFRRAGHRTLDLTGWGGRVGVGKPRRSSSRSLMALKKCGLFHIRSAVSLTMAAGRKQRQWRRPPDVGRYGVGEDGGGSRRGRDRKNPSGGRDCKQGGVAGWAAVSTLQLVSVPNASLGSILVWTQTRRPKAFPNFFAKQVP